MAIDTIWIKNQQGEETPYPIGSKSENVTYNPEATSVVGSVNEKLKEFDTHKNTKAALNGTAGVHGIRYYNDTLEIDTTGNND